MSPLFYLWECPNCENTFGPSYPGLKDTWECPSCGMYLDFYWMIEDLSWVPYECLNYEVEFRREDPLTIHYERNGYPRLCCDQDYEDCKCDSYEEIVTDDVVDFMLFNHIEKSDVYEREYSMCLSCEFYASNDCHPLREVLRFYHQTQVLPFYYLTRCKNFEKEQPYNQSETTGLEYNEELDAWVAT